MIDTGYEKNLIINNRELKYKGIFRVDELFQVINRALDEKGYEKKEKKSEETVVEQGRRVYVELRPYKEKTNYVNLTIKIKVLLDNVKETVEEIKGQKMKFQQGDVLVIFDAWSLTDYQHRWTLQPWVYFLKGVINKYLYTFPLEAGFTRELVRDTGYIYNQVKQLLNSYKFEVGKVAKEEEVRRSVEEEMAKEIEKEAVSEDKGVDLDNKEDKKKELK